VDSSILVKSNRSRIDLEHFFEYNWRSMETSKFIPVLGTVAFGLLVIVTLGIVYLTLLGWRDRQRREQDRRANR
jgi:hypothetical protein